jgi:hypothetical protein
LPAPPGTYTSTVRFVGPLLAEKMSMTSFGSVPKDWLRVTVIHG